MPSTPGEKEKPPDSVTAATVMGYVVIGWLIISVCLLSFIVNLVAQETGSASRIAESNYYVLLILLAIVVFYLVLQCFVTPNMHKGRRWAYITQIVISLVIIAIAICTAILGVPVEEPEHYNTFVESLGVIGYYAANIILLTRHTSRQYFARTSELD